MYDAFRGKHQPLLLLAHKKLKSIAIL